MKALEAAATQALHSGRPGSLCSLLPKSAAGQINTHGDPGSAPAPSPPPRPSRKQTDILLYTHTRTRGHGHTDRTGRKGGRAGPGEPRNPAAHPRVCPAERRPRPGLHAQPPSLGPRDPRVRGKGRLGCSPAAPRPGIQLDVAVMGLSSSRSRLELPGWRLL